MSINLNADIGTILKDLLDKKSKKGGGSTSSSNQIVLYKNTILYAVLIGCAFMIAVFAMYHQAHNSIKPDKSDFKNSTEIEDALKKIEADISTQKAILKQNVQKVKVILPKVTEAGEEKKLFKLISQMAEKNALNLKQINKQNAPVTEADKQQQQKFQESPLTLEIDGKFADYLSFKRDMFDEKPVLRIDTEVIQLNKISETNTLIGIAIRLTDFVINKQEFQRIINKYEKAS